MANGSVTVTGLDALRRKVEALPQAIENSCRKVARDTALRVRSHAAAKVPVDTGITRDSIQVTPHPEEHFYRVEVGPAPHHRLAGRTAFLPNLPIWLEFGTRFKAARPFMRPAIDAEDARYKRDMTSAVGVIAKDLVG